MRRVLSVGVHHEMERLQNLRFQNLRFQNLRRAGIASGWVVIGRLIGLAWTLTLLFRLGVSDYGVYAMAFALAAIVAAPVDNIFYVRSLRIDDEQYRRERSVRALAGAALLVAGIALFVPAFVAGFALIVAGGEVLFNAVKSDALRGGHPQRSVRLDVLRQFGSIALGVGYLFAVPHPQLAIASGFYLLPYLVVAVVACRAAVRARPGLFASRREIVLLVLDAVGIALYLQGDILILGLVTSSSVAGVYSIASLIALAAASVAQVFAQTYNARLRVARGDPAAGPSRRLWFGVALVLGVGVGVVGLGVAVVRPGQAVIPVLLVMSGFAFLRSVSTIMTSFLYVQTRDGHRVLAGGLAAVLKLVLIVLIGPVMGALGAAISAATVELLLAIWFYRVAYSWRPGLSAGPRLPSTPRVPSTPSESIP